jgi:hypothetical protein
VTRLHLQATLLSFIDGTHSFTTKDMTEAELPSLLLKKPFSYAQV